MDSDLVADANDNLQSTFAGLADHGPSGGSRTFGSITAACVGAPIPFFNRVFVFTPPSPEDLTAAVEWMAEQAVPFWVTVPGTVVESVETGVGDLDSELALAKTGASEPGMVLGSLDGIPTTESGLSVDVVTDSDRLDAFVTVSSDAFGMPPEVGRQLTPPSVLADDRMQLFLGRAEDQYVACGLLVRTGDVAGVYTIGVTEAFRRRGFGETMTWAVLEAGRDRGCRMGVLQSSEMGYSVYERMGFETIVDYHHFAPNSQIESGDPEDS